MTRFVTSRTDERREMFVSEAGNDPVDTRHEDHAKEVALACFVMEILQRYYPGHCWSVRVSGGGVNDKGRVKPRGVEVKIPILMGTKSYVIPAPMLMADFNQSCRLIRAAGGEILERFNIPRSGFQLDPFMLARAPRLMLSHKTPMPE